MKNTKLYSLISWFGFILLLLWMTSCGTRKVQTNHTEEKTDLEQKTIEKKDVTLQNNSNVKVTNEITSSDEITTEKKIYTPIDNSKPSTFIDDKGFKKELNNTSYIELKTTSKTHKKGAKKFEAIKELKVSDKSVKEIDSKIKGEKQTKNKNIERTSLKWWWLLWLLIPLAIYIYWRNKDKIWFV